MADVFRDASSHMDSAYVVPKSGNDGDDHNGSGAVGEGKSLTTLLFRNVPRKYTPSTLAAEIEESAFIGAVDFVYLPWDTKIRANLGYAFVNFVSAEVATGVWSDMQGKAWRLGRSNKDIKIVAAKEQGLKANLAHCLYKIPLDAEEEVCPFVRRNGRQIDFRTAVRLGAKERSSRKQKKQQDEQQHQLQQAQQRALQQWQRQPLQHDYQHQSLQAAEACIRAVPVNSDNMRELVAHSLSLGSMQEYDVQEDGANNDLWRGRLGGPALAVPHRAIAHSSAAPPPPAWRPLAPHSSSFDGSFAGFSAGPALAPSQAWTQSALPKQLPRRLGFAKVQDDDVQPFAFAGVAPFAPPYHGGASEDDRDIFDDESQEAAFSPWARSSTCEQDSDLMAGVHAPFGGQVGGLPASSVQRLAWASSASVGDEVCSFVTCPVPRSTWTSSATAVDKTTAMNDMGACYDSAPSGSLVGVATSPEQSPAAHMVKQSERYINSTRKVRDTLLQLIARSAYQPPM